MTHRRFLIESARKLLQQAEKEKGDANDDWMIRNALLSLSMVKDLALTDKEQKPTEHRHD